MRLQVTGANSLLLTRVADNDVAETILQVVDRGRQTEDGHDFGSHDDVEPVFARIAVARTAERTDDMAQCAVVHVNNTLPGDATNVDTQLVTVMDVVVEHRGQQVVGQSDCREVTGEVQIDVFHRHDLSVTTTRSATLDTENRTKRRLTQADHGLLADVVQRVNQTNAGGGLAFTGGGWADCGNQNQFSVFFILEGIQVRHGNLGLIVAIGLQMFFGDPKLFLSQLGDAHHLTGLCNFDITRHDANSTNEFYW